MDYSQKKGFSSGFEQGVKIGSSGAEKRLDMIAKTKEKEQELADKIKGQERIAQFIESEMGNKSGADFIRSLPTAEVSTGIGLLLKSKGEEPSLAEKILAKQYGINLGTTTGNIGNASLTAAVSSQNKGVSSTAPSQVEPSAETSTVPDMRIESVTAGGVTAKRLPTKQEIEQESMAKAAQKTEEQRQKDLLSAQKSARGSFRAIQQFGRSYQELESFDPSIGKEGFSGWMSRKGATLANYFDELPETQALQIYIQPLANGIARDIEGGRVTDNDRKIYADAFANGLTNPSSTNIRLMSSSLIDAIDKGANSNGAVSNILIQMANENTDIFHKVVAQVLEQYPELANQLGVEVEK